MQNELKDISDYLSENLFLLVKQFGTFALTVVFLLCQNFKLAMLAIFPVIPLFIYCSSSSKVIQVYGAYKLIKAALEDNLSIQQLNE